MSYEPVIGLTVGGEHVGLFTVLGAIGFVVGLVAGVQQLTSAVSRRRFRAAEQRILEAAADSIDAEKARREASQYEALREAMRQQVEEEVPAEARRVFLISRRDALRSQIATEVDEYEALESELARIEGRAAGPLDDRLRRVIEASILPAYVRRRRLERGLVGAVLLLIVLSLTPFRAEAVSDAWDNYAASINSPVEYSSSNLYSSLVFGAVVVAGVIFSVGVWALRRGVVRRRLRSLTASLAGMIAVGCAVSVWAVVERSDGEQKARAAQRAYDRAGDLRRQSDNAKSSTRKRRWSDSASIQEKEGNRQAATSRQVQTRASSLFWVGHLLIGAGVGGLLSRLWLRRRRWRALSPGHSG